MASREVGARREGMVSHSLPERTANREGTAGKVGTAHKVVAGKVVAASREGAARLEKHPARQGDGKGDANVGLKIVSLGGEGDRAAQCGQLAFFATLVDEFELTIHTPHLIQTTRSASALNGLTLPLKNSCDKVLKHPGLPVHPRFPCLSHFPKK